MRFCFVLSILVSLGICIAITVHTWNEQKDIPSGVKDFLIWLTTALGLGKVGQKLVETKDSPPPAA